MAFLRLFRLMVTNPVSARDVSIPGFWTCVLDAECHQRTVPCRLRRRFYGAAEHHFVFDGVIRRQHQHQRVRGHPRSGYVPRRRLRARCYGRQVPGRSLAATCPFREAARPPKTGVPNCMPSAERQRFRCPKRVAPFPEADCDRKPVSETVLGRMCGIAARDACRIPLTE